MSDFETDMQLRGQVARGEVAAIRDDGETQTVDVEAHEGMVRGGVEVHQIYGLATCAPEGAVTVLLAVGGDQGDLVALMPACPGVRWGRLASGEVVLYDHHSNRIHLREGGLIEIRAASKVRVEAPRVEIVATAGVEITADVRIVGNLVVTGQVSDEKGSMQEMRGTYNEHTHPNRGADPPTQKME